MSDLAVNEERHTRVIGTLTKLGFFAYLLLEAEVAASIWGRWVTLEWLALLCLACVAVNVSATRLAPRLGFRMAERFRVAGNLVILIGISHLSGWGFPALAMIALAGAAVGSSAGPEAVVLTALLAAIGAGTALLDGAGLVTALALATSVEATFWMVFLSQRVGIDLLDQLEARHLELAVAHTDLRRMQEVVLQQHKLAGLGLMAAGVAHEINNPMAYVTSNVSMLLKDLRAAHGLPPALQEYAAEVLPETLDGIRRVNAIVADLGRFARGDAESGNASYGLNEQVEHALRIAQKELTQRCRVVRDLGESPALFGRPQQITQVLVNLLVNAAQSIAQEGTVTVVTRQNGDEAIVSVSDSGSGMTAETRSHLFEPFFTTKPVGKGTGLGLAVIHGIVRAHGGHIEVESELGKGSRFTVHLPLKAPTTQGEAWASDLQLIALRGAATEEKRPGPRG